MPPKKTPSETAVSPTVEKLCKVITESVDKLVNTVDVLVKRVDTLTSDFATMKDMIRDNSSRIAQLQESRSTANTSYSQAVTAGTRVNSATYNTFLALKSMEERKVHDKDMNLVMVGVSETITDIKDRVLDLLRDCAIPEEEVRDVFRHGEPGSKGARIVKVKLTSQRMKRRIKQMLGKSNLCNYCRNDLSRLELQEDFDARQWCYNENRRLGVRKYKVVDLRVTEYREPRSLHRGAEQPNNVSSIQNDQ